MITSDVIIAKTEEVLRRSSIFDLFPPNRAEARVQGLLNMLRDHAIRTPHALDLRIIEDDPEDDNILIAAVEGKADCIISGDKHLKKLGNYQNIPILSPAEFIAQEGTWESNYDQ